MMYAVSLHMHLVYKICTFSINQKNIYVTDTQKEQISECPPCNILYLKVNINSRCLKSLSSTQQWPNHLKNSFQIVEKRLPGICLLANLFCIRQATDPEDSREMGR